MKKLLSSYFSFVLLFAAFYCCSFIAVSNASKEFGYHAKKMLGYGFNYADWSVAAVFLGAFFFAMLFSAMWVLVKNGRLNAWKSTKTEFIIFTICSFLFMTYIAYKVRFSRLSPLLSIAVLPLITYTIFILWLTRFIAFLQTGGKYKKISWYKFYKQFPIREPISILVTLVALTSLLYLLFDKNTGTIFFSLSAFVLTTILAEYLSRFSESKAARFEEIVEDKLKSERLKTELIANVSHDIKTPLTSIINYADLINNKGIDNEALKEYASVIQKKSLRLKTLIEDLIEASKAGTGNIKMTMRSIDLCELLGQIMGEFDEQMEKNQLQLISKLPDTVINIETDGRYLWRVLENIFSNAVKYSMKGTRVYVDLKSEDNMHMLTLKNISKDPLNISADELTGQFVRGDRARFTEGSGLGLYIAKSLTEAMGGQFDIKITGDLFEVQICFHSKQ